MRAASVRVLVAALACLFTFALFEGVASLGEPLRGRLVFALE